MQLSTSEKSTKIVNVGFLSELQNSHIFAVRREQHFEDDCNLYQFHEDVTSYVDKRVTDSSTSTDGIPSARSSIDSGIGHVSKISPQTSLFL